MRKVPGWAVDMRDWLNWFNPKEYVRWLRRRREARELRRKPNLRGAAFFPPGHYYSPLLDFQDVPPNEPALPFDGPEMWEHVDLRAGEQQTYFEELLSRFPFPPFPETQTDGWRYYTKNSWFAPSDAFTLSAILRKEMPRRIVEVGSGFSSAVMLDTLRLAEASASLTFIEPNPERLDALLSPQDKAAATILVQPVQEVPPERFDQLEAGDVLFIDSSHVAKVGSDVAFLLLRVLPRLKPGVLVHFHDVFYPHSYPMKWIREGRAWNESICLRAYLVGNAKLRILAFNAYARYAFPEVFRERCPVFLSGTGGSIWFRTAA